VNRKLKVLDLFSGIGGFALGLDSTGFFETVKFVEMDKYCQKVLQKNFPNIPIEEDIKNVKGKEYEADVITGGFPCQPFSVAGKQKGTNDNRYLWPEMLRLIREIKPEFVIGENVQGLINLQNGVVLRQVQDDLESEGFEVQCFLIPASGIGAWHQRYRVWIVAHSQHNGLLAAESRCNEEKNRNERKDGEKNSTTGRSIGTSSIRKTDNGYEGCGETSSIKETIVSNTDNIRFERDQQTTETTSGRRTEATSQSNGKDVPNTDTRLSIGENEEVQARRDTSTTSGEDVSNTDSIRHRRWSSEGCTNKGWSFLQREQEGREMGSETQRCDGDVPNTDSERLQGHGLSTNMETKQGSIGSENSVEEQQTWWQTESNLCGVPNGISYELDKNRANRIKTLGNAIVPQIAREFGLAIKKVLSDSDSDGQG
jgi:DNA (cytosine-5)-methyltransferase 1